MKRKMDRKARKIMGDRRGEFGISAILGIAIALTVTAFVVFPGIRDLSQDVMTGLDNWWSNTIADEIFTTDVAATS